VKEMEKFKFTKEHLDGNDRVAALMMLLLQKGIVTEEELEGAMEAVVEIKNQKLEEEREKYPGMSMMFDLMAGNVEKKDK
jgi:TPP-dependent pyruvate/acetoin dehydrogenase alpha subunit